MLAGVAPCAALTLRIGTPAAAPGALVQVAVQIATDGEEVGSLEHELTFDPTVLRLHFRGASPDCFLDPSISRQLDVRVAPGGGRVEARVLPAFPSGPIDDGLLYSCAFEVAAQAGEGDYPLVTSALRATSPDGTPIGGLLIIGGLVTVTREDRVLLEAGEAQGVAGGSVHLPIFLDPGGFLVSETESRIEFDRSRVRVPETGSIPDCEINPLTGKQVSSILIEPDVLVVRVLPVLGRSPIPQGELFSCTFRIAGTAPLGGYPVRVTEVRAWDDEGREIVLVEGADGVIRVGLPPCGGDCDEDGRVTVDELVRGVGLALEDAPPGDCPAMDPDGDERISINELIGAVGHALTGC